MYVFILTREQPAGDGDGEGHDECQELHEGLVTGTAAVGDLREHVAHVVAVEACVAGHACGHHGREPAEDAGHAVQVVDAAGVVQAYLLLEHGLDVHVADGREGARGGPHQEGAPAPEVCVGDRADGHAAGERGVLYVDHAEGRKQGSKEWWRRHGRETRL